MSKHPAFELQRNLQETGVPSNVQLEKGIDTAKSALDTEISKRGNAPETKLAKDASHLLETSKQFIQEKNEGELLQTFIADTKEAIQELTTQMNSQEFWIQRTKLTLAAAKNISNVNQLAQLNIDSMKNLALTLVNSGEFRSLIVEFINLAQSMVDIEQTKTGPLPSLTPEPTGTIPLTEEAKLKAQQVASVGQQVFQDISQGKVEIPEDRKLAVRQKFRDLINRLNAEPSFQESVYGLFNFFDQIQFYASQLKVQAQQQAQQIQGTIQTPPAVWKMWSDGKAFIGNFVGTEQLNSLNTDCYNFFNLVWNDQRLSQFFWDLRNFITAVIQNPSLFDTDDFVQKWNDLYAYGYQWMNDPRYRDCLWNIYADLNLCFVAFQKDTLTQQLQQDLTKIARDLVLDESGKPSLNIMSSGLANLKTLVVPVIRKYLENVPIPAFSGSNDTYDWQVQQMYVNAATLVPDNIEIKVWGDGQISLTDQPSKANTYITMWIRDVGFHAKDLKFHFTRKSIPRLDETGIADVCITGKGSTLKIVWRIVGDQSTQWVWSVHQVRCDLRDVDITIKESTHTWLMKFVTSLFSGSIRRSIEDKIEQSIGEGLGTINDKLNEAVQAVPTIY